MNTKEILTRAKKMLTASNIEDVPLEAELLLRHTLKISRVQLYSEFDRALSPRQEEAFWNRIERRLIHEPSAYILEHREFYGLDFYVDQNVLIPRPESELLVEQALRLAQKNSLSNIVDVGTGCGAIAITLALRLPQAKIYATDISASALRVARSNCQRHWVADRVCLLDGDMLDPLPEPVDLIIANLPYVRTSDLPGTKELSFEPRLALDGGSDGLGKIHQLCLQVSDKLRSGDFLLLEIGEGQGRAVTTFLHQLFPLAKIEVTPDLGGIDRVVNLALP